MLQKDAKVQLQNAAALVNQWHAAYMEVHDHRLNPQLALTSIL